MSDLTPLTVTLTREQLYDRVWSASAVQLAKELGISDVAIGKACKRYQIPKPPAGYWAKVANGASPTRPPLPVIVDPKMQKITFWPGPPRTERPPAPGNTDGSTDVALEFVSTNMKELGERMKASSLSWAVPTSLQSLHPVVELTMEALKQSAKEKRYVRPGKPDLLYPSSTRIGRNTLDIRVAPGSVDRAIKLAQGLIRAAQAVGFSFKEQKDSYRGYHYLELFGHQIQFSIVELSNREPHVPTAKELADSAKYSYSKPPKWDHLPNGMLCVNLFQGNLRTNVAEIADGKVRRVEQMVREIVVAMLKEVDVALERRRVQWEEQRRAMEAADARRREEEQRRLEQKELDDLVAQAERWELSERLRRYRAEAEEVARTAGALDDPSSKMHAWLRWVANVADRVDPLSGLKKRDEPAG